MDTFQLNILIVEDNLSFALELEMLLEDMNYNVLAHVDNSADALDVIFSKNPDLILMDIDIKGSLTGLEVGEKIVHLDIPILYITSNNDKGHYEAAKKSNIIGYLTKPIDKITLQSTIEMSILRANRTIEPDDKTESNNLEYFINKGVFFFKKKKSFHKVKIADISFIKSDRNYCESVTVTREVFTNRITLAEIKEMLPTDQFMQVHRQYIVQVSHIEAINFQDSILRIQQNSIPVSRTKRKELEEMIKRFS